MKYWSMIALLAALFIGGAYAAPTVNNNMFINASLLKANPYFSVGPIYYKFGSVNDIYNITVTLDNGTVLKIKHVKQITMMKEDKKSEDLKTIYSYLYNTAAHTQSSLCKGDDLTIQVQCECAKNTKTPCMAYCYKCVENSR